jgi:DNA polymerase type B, organellar and viral
LIELFENFTITMLIRCILLSWLNLKCPWADQLHSMEIFGSMSLMLLVAEPFFWGGASEITSPVYLAEPILQRKCKTVDGMRTIAGLGTWNGWIFSREMDNAIDFGYKFKIIKGYQFEEANIFESFINEMYELRLRYDKSNPMNLVAKLLMNSLYGKFGMSSQKTDITFFDSSKVEDNEKLMNLINGDQKGLIIDWLAPPWRPPKKEGDLVMIIKEIITPELVAPPWLRQKAKMFIMELMLMLELLQL